MTNKRDHGDGGIDERSPGHYRLRWRVDGKRFSKTFRGSVGEARKELRRGCLRAPMTASTSLPIR